MASSVTNTTFMVGNGFSADGQRPTDLLAAAYRRTRQPAVDALQTNQNRLTQRQVFYNTLRTKLETIQSAASSLTDSTASAKYSVKKVTSSDATTTTATATSEASLGASSIKVDRLATTDTLLTESMSRTQLFSQAMSARGVTTLPTVVVGSTLTEVSLGFTLSGRSYSVSYDSASDTSESMMKKVAAAITADSSAKVNASYIQDSSSTGRISFTSKSTGTENAITFSGDSAVLKGLGLGGITQSAEGAYASVNGLYLDSNTRNSLVPGADQTFSFQVNEKTYSVSVASNDQNRQILDSISAAIQSNPPANVTVSQETSSDRSSTRLVLSNSQPNGSLSIKDTSGLLTYVGIPTQDIVPSRTVAGSVKAGYLLSVESTLNSKATVNGVSVTRSSNTLTDVLPGMSINLLKAQGSSDAATQLTVETDSDKVITTIQPLLDSYNDALKYIQGNLRTNAGNDSSIRTLQSQVRSLSTTMFGESADSFKYLTDIGIKIDKDGTLSVGDKDKLKSAITDKSDLVQKIFSGSNGLASRLQSTVSGFVGTEGIATSRSKVLGTQIASSTTKINQLKARIDKEVEQQLKDYKKLQESFYKLQGQMSQYSSFN